MNRTISQQTESLRNQYRTNLLSCSRWGRQQTHSFLELHVGLMKTPVQVRPGGGGRTWASAEVKHELPVHLLAFDFGFGAAASQGVTNPAATCSYSFILFPPRPRCKIWQPCRNTVPALSHHLPRPPAVAHRSAAGGELRGRCCVSPALILLSFEARVGCPSRNRT